MTNNAASMASACEAMGLEAKFARKLEFFVTKVPPPAAGAVPPPPPPAPAHAGAPAAPAPADDHHYLPRSERLEGETRKDRRRRIARRLDEVSSVLDTLPRNLVQLLRVTGLVRQTARELGVENYEFLTTYAYYAVYGLYRTSSFEVPQGTYAWLEDSLKMYSALSVVWLTGATVSVCNLLFAPRGAEEPEPAAAQPLKPGSI